MNESLVELKQRLRQFFVEREFHEVETPLLMSEVIPELHIDPLPVEAAPGLTHWLQPSPEAAMKRYLVARHVSHRTAEPVGIFQICAAFRKGEFGPHHHPEFTMLEWYHTGHDLRQSIEFTGTLLERISGAAEFTLTTYRDAFARHAGLNPFAATEEQLRSMATYHGVAVDQHTSRDDLLNMLLVKAIEPQLGIDGPEALCEYPASQAALAEVITDAHGTEVAARFEIYWRGVELANGYQELTDAAQLRTRFEQVLRERESLGKPPLPMPEDFLAAMEQGLPPCAGVALGVDRLAMLIDGRTTLGSH